MSRSVLVTGGAGFIGSHLVDRLLKENWKVKVIDNLSSGRLENLFHHSGNPNLKIVIGDLKDMETCLKVVEGIDVVFHFAANPEVRVSTTNPEIHFRENIITTFNLLEAVRKKDIKEFIFASSSSVYGELDAKPVIENAPIRPVSIYGASKASCESLIHAYSKLYGIKAVILRYANVIGPRLRHGVVYDLLLKLKKNPRQLEILGDGKQVRSFIYIDDAISATIIAWRKSNLEYSIYNVASEDWITIKEVADIIINELGLRNVKYVYKSIRHGIGWLGDVKRIALNIDSIKSLGFRPKFTSREAVKKTIKSLIKELNIL